MPGLTALTAICGVLAALWLLSIVFFLWLINGAPELPDPDGESL